jgi:hypothetical protein
MKADPDINDTLRSEGADAVRARHDAAHKKAKTNSKGEHHAPRTLAEVRAIFKQRLGDEYDMATLDATCAVAAAENLPGDPPWLLIISGPGNAKTETVQSVSAVPGAHVISTITSELRPRNRASLRVWNRSKCHPPTVVRSAAIRNEAASPTASCCRVSSMSAVRGFAAAKM